MPVSVEHRSACAGIYTGEDFFQKLPQAVFERNPLPVTPSPQAGFSGVTHKTPFCRYQEKEGRRIAFFAKGKDCAVISLA
jgi:hypothetical protein